MQTTVDLTQGQLSTSGGQAVVASHHRALNSLILSQPIQAGDGAFARNVEQPRSMGQTLIVDETDNYTGGFIPDDDEDSDEPDIKRGRHDGKGGLRQKKTRGRVKIKMEFIQNKLRRYTTFSKRKTGIMKKAYELSTLTGTQVMLLVASETGHVYTFATRKLQPMITSESGKALIQTCLNSPDPAPLTTQTNPNDQRMSQTGYEETDLQYSTAEEEAKAQVSTAITGGSIANSLVAHGQPSFPLTTYVAPSNNQVNSKGASVPVTYSVQTVAGGSLTAIFTPSTGQTVPVQQPTPSPATSQASSVQAQVLSGQLQLHRIHPQNIVLTGNNAPVQPGHIIINQHPGTMSGIPVVLADSGQVSGSQIATQGAAMQGSCNGQENIITILSNSEVPSGAVQMIYNANGNILYASSNVLHSDGQVTTPVASESGITSHHDAGIQSVGTSVLDSSGDGLPHVVNGTIVCSASESKHGSR